jgi:hypothetical protein
MLGFDRPTTREELVARVAEAPAAVAELVPLFRGGLEAVRETERPLTDDRAPVEWLTDRMIVEYVAEGGEVDEDYLPTEPE